MNEIKEWISKPVSKKVIATPINFQALAETIDEISETENIKNEKEFFDLYEIKILKLNEGYDPLDSWIKF